MASLDTELKHALAEYFDEPIIPPKPVTPNGLNLITQAIAPLPTPEPVYVPVQAPPTSERPMRIPAPVYVPPDGPAIPQRRTRLADRLAIAAREEFKRTFAARYALEGRAIPQPDSFTILDLRDGLCHYPSSAHNEIEKAASEPLKSTAVLRYYKGRPRTIAQGFRRDVPAPVFFCGRQEDRHGYCAEHAARCFRSAWERR